MSSWSIISFKIRTPLEEQESAEAVAFRIEIRWVIIDIGKPVIVVRPDVLDLEGSSPPLGYQILEMRGQTALCLDPVGQPGEDVADLAIVLLVKLESGLACKRLRLLVELVPPLVWAVIAVRVARGGAMPATKPVVPWRGTATAASVVTQGPASSGSAFAAKVVGAM